MEGDIISDKKYTFTNLEGQPDEQYYGGTFSGSRIQGVGWGRFSHNVWRQFFDKIYMGLLKEEDVYDNTGRSFFYNH